MNNQRKQICKNIEWTGDDGNSSATHATAKGASTFLCQLISELNGHLAKETLKQNPKYSFMGEMLADCFCTKRNKIAGFDEHDFRTDFRMLEFIKQAVEDKLNDQKFLEQFVREEFLYDRVVDQHWHPLDVCPTCDTTVERNN